MATGNSTTTVTVGNETLSGTFSWNINDRYESGEVGKLRRGTIELTVAAPRGINWNNPQNVQMFETAVSDALKVNGPATLAGAFGTTSYKDGDKQYNFDSAHVGHKGISGSPSSSITVSADATLIYKAPEVKKSQGASRNA